jgi:hypothetical protein
MDRMDFRIFASATRTHHGCVKHICPTQFDPQVLACSAASVWMCVGVCGLCGLMFWQVTIHNGDERATNTCKYV